MAAVSSDSPRVAIVVLNYNGLDDTLKCLESLRVLRTSVDVILVDNASKVDPSVDALKIYPSAHYVRTERNLGYAGGNNRGIDRALALGADYVLILNNDTVVEPDIVARLLHVVAGDRTIGIVGPVVNFMDEPDAVMTDGVAFNPGPGTEFFRRIPVPTDVPGRFLDVDIVNGCCMMIATAVIKAVGTFDESFFIVHEEADLCLRARRAGFRCVVLGESLVRHKGSSAFERSGRQLQRYFDARNLWHLLKRHTGRVGTSRSFATSVKHYFLYCFYRYEIERDADKTAAADAVVFGVWDGLMGRFGPYPAQPSTSARAVRGIFALGWRLSRWRR